MKSFFFIILEFGKAFLCSVGALETILFIWNWLEMPSPTVSPCLRLFLVGVATTAWFVIDGFFVSGFLKQTIRFSICEGSASLSVSFGDLFKAEGLKVIPVNAFFDSIVNESVVAASSLHGIMLTRFFAGNIGEFDSQIAQSLSLQGISPVARHQRLGGVGKTEEYPIGSAAIVKAAKGEEFLCVALSKTDVKNNQASASLNDVYEAVLGALAMARSWGNGHPVIFPLLGDGLSRTSLSPVFLLNLIIQGIISGNKAIATKEIHVALHPSKRGDICLRNIEKAWK